MILFLDVSAWQQTAEVKKRSQFIIYHFWSIIIVLLKSLDKSEILPHEVFKVIIV